MPTTTQTQLQHKLLQQHQQAAVQSGLASATAKTGANINDANELLRLKAQVMSLTDRTNQLNANLASTSESVVRGNKALTAERAQFHAKFAGVTRKLEATQAALAEAEAFPVEATKNAKLLNAKILELQEENHQLTQTRATLEATIEAKAAEVAALHDASQTAVGTQAALQAQCDDLTSKYGALAKQHSQVLARQEELTEELQEHQAALIDAEARADAAVSDLEATKLEVATADQLVDELDAKLAETRVAAIGAEGEETWTIAEREAAIEAPGVEATVDPTVDGGRVEAMDGVEEAQSARELLLPQDDAVRGAREARHGGARQDALRRGIRLRATRGGAPLRRRDGQAGSVEPHQRCGGACGRGAYLHRHRVLHGRPGRAALARAFGRIHSRWRALLTSRSTWHAWQRQRRRLRPERPPTAPTPSSRQSPPTCNST